MIRAALLAALAVSVAGGALAADTNAPPVREICVANRTVMTVTVFRRVPASAKNAYTANLERLGVAPAGKTACLKPERTLADKEQLVVGAARPTHALCPTTGDALRAGELRLDYAGRGACRPTQAD